MMKSIDEHSGKSPASGNGQDRQVESARVTADGTIIIPHNSDGLKSVDVADVDLLLSFADGSFVVISNGALDAISETFHRVFFIDADDSGNLQGGEESTLSDLFKMVGTTNLAKAGSLRVVSEHVDAQPLEEQGYGYTPEEARVEESLPEPPELKVHGGSGKNAGIVSANSELLDPISEDPVQPIDNSRPTVVPPGHKVFNTEPTVTLDENVTPDDVVNIAEGNGTVTVSGAAGGTAIVGDTVILTVNGTDYSGLVELDMSFHIDVAGSDLINDPDKLVDASITSNNKTGVDSDLYGIDITPPTPSVTLDSAITADDIINIAESNGSVVVSGSVGGDAQNGDLVTLTINGQQYSGFVSGSRFSIDVAGNDLANDADKVVDASVLSHDPAGNPGSAVDSEGYSVDFSLPAPTISLDTEITADDIINIAESGGDVVVTGTTGGDAAAGDLVSLMVNGTESTGLVRADGTFSITVLGSDLAADPDSMINASVTSYNAVGNPGTTATVEGYGVDITAPSATILVDDNALSAGETSLVTITFNEAVSDFSNADISLIENATLSPVSTSDGGTTWIATLTPDAPVEDPSNLIVLNNSGVLDQAGNPGSGISSSNNYAVDTITPTVTDIQVNDTLLSDADSGSGTFSVSVTYSEAMDAGSAPILSFAPDPGGALVPGGGSWSNGNTTYTVSYNLVDTDLDLSVIDLDVSGALDAIGNTQQAHTASGLFAIDTANPTVIISNDSDGLVNDIDSEVHYTLTFSEAVSSIDASDLTISGGTLTSAPLLAADGLSAKFSLTAPDNSTTDMSVTINGSIVDLNGNTLVPATDTLPVDTFILTGGLSHDNLDGVVSDGDSLVNYTLNFSDKVSSISAADLSISGGTLTGGPVLAADGYSADFSVIADDASNTDLAVTANSSIADQLGHPLVPVNSTLSVDTANPIATLATDNSDGTVSDNDSTVNCTLNFSEAVASVSAADLVINGGTLSSGPVLAADGLSADFIVNVPDDSTTPLSISAGNSILDLNGNTLVPSNTLFNVDTSNPVVTGVRTNDLQVTSADAGTETFGIVVDFSETMDPDVIPTISFGSDLSGSLVFSSDGWFSGKTTYVAIFDVIDTDLELNDITIDVLDARDAAGNLQQDYTARAEFSIDTLSPSVMIANDNLDGTVNDADNVVNYTLTFSEEVAALSSGDLSISGGTLDAAPVLSADGLSATFSVTADDNSTADLSVTLNSSVVDLNGNPLVPANDNLPVNTVNLPDFSAELYTTPEYKVTGGGATPPTGSYVPAATDSEHALAASPAGQAARDTITGTAGNDTITHNPIFSADNATWVKTIHLDFSVFTDLTQVELIADPAISGIPGFTLSASGLIWDGANTWTLSPDAATSSTLLLNGLDVDIAYSVAGAGGPIDFSMTVNVSGMEGANVFDQANGNPISHDLNFSWRQAQSEADFDLTVAGDQVMVLPRDGMGLEIQAGDGDDTINSGAGNDLIYGGTGNDNIDSGGGDDILVGGSGADVLDGGSGNDTASFDGSTSDLDASLATGLGTLGDAAGDQYFNIENLTGGAGDDSLEGDTGANILDGGLGNDTASYANSVAAVGASLLSGTGTTGDASGDTFLSIENLTGGAGNDWLSGDNNDNILNGSGGNDLLIGAGGNDHLDGGTGNDTASYADSSGAVNATLAGGNAVHGSSVDSLVDIENLHGSSYADILTGNAGDNILTGGGGADQLSGGAGTDTASYADAGSGVTASLTSSFSPLQSGEAQGDSFSSVENLVGSMFDDNLYGDSAANTLNGSDGNDFLAGLAGDDTLIGGAGNDSIFADDGNDSVDGGTGDDSIYLSTDPANLPTHIDGGTGNDSLILQSLTDGGSYDLTTLANQVDNIETLSIRDGVSSELVISAADIQNLVDNGNASQLVIQTDAGDTLTFSAAAAELMSPGFTQGVDATYTISDGALQIAQIHWDVS